MKWDLSEQYLPWRFFISNSISNNTIPYWNPFQLGGNPTYADPQSGFWYLPVWIISIFKNYNMQIIELEILFHLIIASIGFYKLSKALNNSNIISLVISICFVGSGFFVGNAQHLTWIIAATWTPWLFYFYYKIIFTKDFKYPLLFSITTFLFLAGSYPAFAIVNFYLLFFLTIFHLIYSSEKIKDIKRILLTGVFTFLLCFGIIYSYIHANELYSRGTGIVLAKALQHPFSYQSWVSFIFPFSSFKDQVFFNTDQSMSNGYLGIIPIMVIGIWLFVKKKPTQLSLFILSIIFLSIAIGEILPIRKLLFEYAPGFNLFRFPALFRLYAIIFLLLLFANVWENSAQLKNISKRAIFSLIALIIIIAGFFLIKYYQVFTFFSFDTQTLSDQISKSNIIQHLLFQGLIQCIFLVLFLYIILFKQKYNLLLLFVMCDILISVKLNSVATVILPTKSRLVDQLIPVQNSKFIPPLIQQSKSIDQAIEYRWPLNWNMNCYYENIAIDGYNPFVLNTFNTLSESKYIDTIWNNAWIYSPNLSYYQKTIPNLKTANTWTESDSTKSKSYVPIKFDIVDFSPTKISIETNADVNSALVLSQNPYPFWIASINGQNVNIETVNFSQQMIEVPKGKNLIIWEFKASIIQYLLIFTATIFILYSIIVIYSYFNLKT